MQSAPGLAVEDANADLHFVAMAWPSLSDDAKHGILEIVRREWPADQD